MIRGLRPSMPVRLAALVMALLLCGTASAGWRIEPRPAPGATAPATAVLVYPAAGDASAGALRRALDEHAARGDIRHLDTMVAHGLAGDRDFRRELAEGLRRAAPRELAAALDSAGNMHNPRVVPLRTHVEQAILETPTLQALASVLSAHGLGFSHAAIEKFTVSGSAEEPVFSFMLFVGIQPVPAADDGPR